MEHVRTMKVPVHYLTTRRKRSCLYRLTARLTYAVRAWSGIIEEHGLRTRDAPCDSRMAIRRQEDS